VDESEPNPPSLLSRVKAIGATGLASLQNRSELFILELEEERSRLIEMLVWALVAGLLGLMFLAVLTILIVMLFPPDERIWALTGFCVLYLIGGVLALLNLKSLLRSGPPPFAESVNEIKKDSEWLESLK
jgi:uncharacterized membrane protein YqjE